MEVDLEGQPGDNNFPKHEEKFRQPKSTTERMIVRNNVNSDEISEVDKQIFERMERSSDGTFTCKICGKSSVKKRAHMRNHIETHLEGLSFDCQHCGKVFRSRNALGKHIHYEHKSIQ